MTTIANNIKRLRVKRGLTQDEFVKKTGLKYSTYAKIEGGFVKKPGVQMIAKIAKALEVSIEELLK